MVHNPLVSLHGIGYPSSNNRHLRVLGDPMAGRRITTLDIRELIRHLRETTNAIDAGLPARICWWGHYPRLRCCKPWSAPP